MRFLRCIIALCTMLTLLFSCTARQPETHFTVIYVSNLNGALDDCQCDEVLAGGLTRVIPLVEQLRQSNNPTLVLAGGDILTSYDLRHNNRLMLRMLEDLSLDAIAIGDQEFVQGREFLTGFADDRNSVPLLSHNLLWQPDEIGSGNPLTLLRGEDTFAVAALVDTNIFRFIEQHEMKILPAEQWLSNQTNSMMTANFQILMWHGEWTAARNLAQQFPWLDLILIAHNQALAKEVIGNTILVETGVDGEYIGEIKYAGSDQNVASEVNFIAVKRNLPAGSSLATNGVFVF